MGKKVKKSLEDKQWSTEKAVKKLAKDSNCKVEEILDKCDGDDIVEFVKDNWKRVTGTRAKTMSYEQDFPGEVYALCDAIELPFDSFQNAWSG